MKKKGFYFVTVLLLCILVSPLKASAATGVVFGSTDTSFTSTTLNAEETQSSGSISISNNGTNSSFYLGVKSVDGILPSGTQFTATLKLGNSSFNFTSCARMSNSGWSISCVPSDEDPTVINITATSTAAMNAGQKVAIARVNLDGSGATASTDPCTITLEMNGASQETPEENPTCQIDGDTYYCANGEVCTEEEYNAQCTTTENPQTGSFIPYAVIVGGIAVAIGLYMFTKKNKIYHI